MHPLNMKKYYHDGKVTMELNHSNSKITYLVQGEMIVVRGITWELGKKFERIPFKATISWIHLEISQKEIKQLRMKYRLHIACWQHNIKFTGVNDPHKLVTYIFYDSLL